MRSAASDLETMDKPVKEYGDLVVRTARGNAPSRTGALRQSIVVQGESIVATVRYALPVEFGSRRGNRRAVHFMGRALASTERDRDVIFTRGADHICDQIKGV